MLNKKWIFKVCIFFIGKSQKDCCLFFITSNPVSIFGGLHPDVTGDHLVFPFPESWALMQPRSCQNLTWNTKRREDRETVETFWTFNERDILGTVWPKRGARNASHTISTPTQCIGAYNFELFYQHTKRFLRSKNAMFFAKYSVIGRRDRRRLLASLCLWWWCFANNDDGNNGETPEMDSNQPGAVGGIIIM